MNAQRIAMEALQARDGQVHYRKIAPLVKVLEPYLKRRKGLRLVRDGQPGTPYCIMDNLRKVIMRGICPVDLWKSAARKAVRV